MAILNISVNNYKGSVGYEGLSNPKDIIRKIIGDTIDVSAIGDDTKEFSVDVYHMNMTSHFYSLGEEGTYLIIMNGHTINGTEITNAKYGTIMESSGLGEKFFDDDGVLIAEYYNNNNSSLLSIFPNLLNSEEGLKEFRKLMVKVNEKIISKIANKDSFKLGNREKLEDRIKSSLDRRVSELLNDTDNEIRHVENSIIHNRDALINCYNKLSELMMRKESSEKIRQGLEGKMINEIDLILKHNKVKDVKFTNNKLIIETEELDIYASNGYRYYGGYYSIIINLLNSNVKFKGNNRRRSWWSYEDIHPHISGDGTACLGNLEPTIIELLSQNEIYATTLSLIDFLENANVSDPAGACVKYWDRYDDEGVLREPSWFENDYSDDEDEDEYDTYLGECYECGVSLYESNEDSRLVYESITIYEDGEYELGDERLICEHCCDRYYEYEEHSGEFVHVDYITDRRRNE